MTCTTLSWANRIDSVLDTVTDALGAVDHPDHPVHLAVGQLRYIIGLAHLQQAVNQRVQALP